MAIYAPTERTTPTRLAERSSYDAAAIHAVLDEALTCHVGYIVDRRPVVLPTIHTRLGESLYLHSSSGSRLSRLAQEPGGVPVCVTVTLMDGVVLARSYMHHSMNYRSVAVHGSATPVQDDDERAAALRAVVEHVVPGRAALTRPPTRRELAATTVLRVALNEASLKQRTGPPKDDDEDLDYPAWAGVLAVRTEFGPAQPSPDLAPGIAPGHDVTGYRRP